MDDLAKAHVKGYFREDGVWVRPHERGAESVSYHPRRDDAGKRVAVKSPSYETGPSSWHNPEMAATFVPDGNVPVSINDIPLTRWQDHPITDRGWDYVDGINHDLVEPDFHVPSNKHAASGAVIEEADGRIWLVAPTNGFGGYQATFPKGTVEYGLSLQGNAIKEVFEESGLKIVITGLIGDCERTTSVARIYRARRVGGSPVFMGWETQAVHLVPRERLGDHLNMKTDHAIVGKIRER